MILVTLLVIVTLRLLYEHHRDRRLPPGPRRLPLLGNLHQAPKTLPWRIFTEWSKTYGPIMSAQFGRQTLILITSPTIAHDLLDRRGSIYANRPELIMAQNITKGLHILTRQYDSWTKLHQRLEAPVLSPRASNTYLPIQDLESKQLLFDLLGSNNFDAHFERYSGSLMFALAYGFRLPVPKSRELRDMRTIQGNFVYAAQVGRWIVDAIPVLNYLPAVVAPWKRIAEELFQLESKVHARHLARGLASQSWNWTKEFSRSKYASDMSAVELGYDLGILVDAGFETTWAVLKVFVLAVRVDARFVEVARRELDEVVGKDRLPGFEDMERLVYVQAVVDETLRWRSMAPGGVPHATTKEDEYMGYRIPKGATVVPLFWAMSLDEARWEDPMVFRPERWLEGETEGQFTNFFGYGRRICPGRHIARNSLFLLMARILWAFDIQAPLGEDGKPIPVDDMAFDSGFVSSPDPFEAVFVPRSDKTKEVVEREWLGAEKDLEVLMGGIRDRQREIGLDVKA
ncbi:cytochrome P450 [Aspergillus ibericus CBS 121593]|uniref:Cytochrome P450 oxidoreductase n=1 Tax=Aspergillus ibericus CBS 121593 TaxID=1448316 RepID=A0A395GYZ9_9EURO|nr:cytochrome P450 oxidoreductase [Aspergillus ibericus CBS 121593]RAL00821.1 cytochrome P450 oxidoreductase [Aspergillus ibericus CBS 121593]